MRCLARLQHAALHPVPPDLFHMVLMPTQRHATLTRSSCSRLCISIKVVDLTATLSSEAWKLRLHFRVLRCRTAVAKAHWWGLQEALQECKALAQSYLSKEATQGAQPSLPRPNRGGLSLPFLSQVLSLRLSLLCLMFSFEVGGHGVSGIRGAPGNASHLHSSAVFVTVRPAALVQRRRWCRGSPASCPRGTSPPPRWRRRPRSLCDPAASSLSPMGPRAIVPAGHRFLTCRACVRARLLGAAARLYAAVFAC